MATRNLKYKIEYESKHFTNGLPRKVDSLCPECLKVIKARIFEENNKIFMEKTCEEDGYFKDILSSDAKFFLRMEKLRFGDGYGIKNPNVKHVSICPLSCGLCNLHLSTTNMGLIDLTNKCNLRCPFCFANSNVAGYVYEPNFNEVVKMLENLKNVKPAYAGCMQFSGGEPTLHPRFLDIIKKTREIGFTQIQIATNGITMAMDEGFAKKCSEAGLNILYLQFDGVSDDVYLKTRGTRLFEIKKKAIENAGKYGIRTILVPTLIKGVNNHQVGDIYRFAVENIENVCAISWQPVALTGRLPKKEREKMRYTLTDLAIDTEKQFNNIKMNHWYPLAYVSPFSRFLEKLIGKPASALTCHSHCGTGTYIFIDKHSKEAIPIPDFIDVEGLMSRFEELSKKMGKIIFLNKLVAFKYLKKMREFYNEKKAPANMSFNNFIEYLSRFIFTENFSDNKKKQRNLAKEKWRILIIAGMHFQDNYNYEIERVKRCVVHYAAPDGKLYPFCAYNSGLYFRDKIEKNFAKYKINK